MPANATLKAVIIELTGGNVRNHHIYLQGALGLFPDDSLGGSNKDEAGKPIEMLIGTEKIETDIDATKSILRERGAIRRFFESENLVERDLVMLERLSERSYRLSKASKRGFKYYL